MTWRRPRLQADAKELAKGAYATIESMRLRTAMISIGPGQTISHGGVTTVQFANPPAIEHDTINLDLDQDILSIWDTTNHTWLIPADARYVALYGDVLYDSAAAAGTYRLFFSHVRPTVFTHSYGLTSFYAPGVGIAAAMSCNTTFIQVEPADTIKLLTLQETGSDDTIVLARFAIQFLEA